MLGDNLRVWFALFRGTTTHEQDGDLAAGGWVNWSDIENRFKFYKLTFAGKPYDSDDQAQRNKLLDTIVNYASAFVAVGLLERRRQIAPPSLDYRVTKLGRWVGNWGNDSNPGFKAKSFFFLLALSFKAYKFKKLIAIGAVGWGVLNAVKFYATAISWTDQLPFAAWTAAFIAGIVAICVLVRSIASGGE